MKISATEMMLTNNKIGNKVSEKNATNPQVSQNQSTDANSTLNAMDLMSKNNVSFGKSIDKTVQKVVGTGTVATVGVLIANLLEKLNSSASNDEYPKIKQMCDKLCEDKNFSEEDIQHIMFYFDPKDFEAKIKIHNLIKNKFETYPHFLQRSRQAIFITLTNSSNVDLMENILKDDNAYSEWNNQPRHFGFNNADEGKLANQLFMHFKDRKLSNTESIMARFDCGLDEKNNKRLCLAIQDLLETRPNISDSELEEFVQNEFRWLSKYDCIEKLNEYLAKHPDKADELNKMLDRTGDRASGDMAHHELENMIQQKMPCFSDFISEIKANLFIKKD